MSVAEGDLDPFMSVPKVAALFDVKPETVRDWLTSGKMEGIKINGYWKIRRSEVVRFGNSKYGG